MIDTFGNAVVSNGTVASHFLGTTCSVYIIQAMYLPINTDLPQEPLNLTANTIKVEQECIVSK
jgi:hypothetical protein